jgi:hypothetical protein
MHSNTNTKSDASKKTPKASPSADSSAPVPMIEGLPADVYNYLAQVLSHEMVLYEAARHHSRHNAEQCDLLTS